MWQVFLTSEAEKSVKKIPRNIVERAKDVLREISRDPFYGKALRGNLSGRFSARIGEYRIVYTQKLEKHQIWVLYVRHRKDAYK